MEKVAADLNRRQFLAGVAAGSALLATGTMSAPPLLYAASGYRVQPTSDDRVQPMPGVNRDHLVDWEFAAENFETAVG